VHKTLIVDDSDIFRRSLRIIVEASAEWTICGEAASAEDGARFAAQLAPDAIVMDISMRGVSGIEAVRRIRGELPESKNRNSESS
jgi:DNA-binding NarL/FixJ family response regulator